MGEREGKGLNCCPTCRKKLVRKPTEKIWTFARRKYCGRECQYRGMLTLTPAQVTEARKMILMGMPTIRIARAFKVSSTVVQRLVMNQTYQHIPWPE